MRLSFVLLTHARPDRLLRRSAARRAAADRHARLAAARGGLSSRV